MGIENQNSLPSERLESVESEEALEDISGSIELSPVFDEDFAVCVIKPDAYDKREEIIRRIENSGFSIVKRASRQIPGSFLEKVMYRDCTPDEIEATHKHFSAGPSEILMIRGGKDVVDKISKLAGLKTNPAENDPESLRYKYGNHQPVGLPDGSNFYYNAVHRPKTKEEQINELEEFRNLF